MEQLKACIKRYQAVDNKLRMYNDAIYPLREERRAVEVEMTEIVKQPQFAEIDKLKISDDDSTIRISRPGWIKPWTLSQKELGSLVTTYFNQAMAPNAEECVDFVIAEKKKTQVSTEFAFNRVVKE